MKRPLPILSLTPVTTAGDAAFGVDLPRFTDYMGQPYPPP